MRRTRNTVILLMTFVVLIAVLCLVWVIDSDSEAARSDASSEEAESVSEEASDEDSAVDDAADLASMSYMSSATAQLNASCSESSDGFISIPSEEGESYVSVCGAQLTDAMLMKLKDSESQYADFDITTFALQYEYLDFTISGEDGSEGEVCLKVELGEDPDEPEETMTYELLADAMPVTVKIPLDDHTLMRLEGSCKSTSGTNLVIYNCSFNNTAEAMTNIEEDDDED